MNCKHSEIRGTTTKYYYCKIKNKAVDDSKCKNCIIMKLSNLPDIFGKIFGKGFRK